MGTEHDSFGAFLTEKREKQCISLRRFAQELGVSPAFITEVEKNRSAPLTAERLAVAANVLHLSPEEKAEMYDLAGRQRDLIAPDLPEYIKGRDYVSYALRAARDLGADENDWLQFVEELKKRKG